jgi:hypothetical protein
VVRQWDILKMMVPEDEIPSFADPLKWLSYFPPYGKVLYAPSLPSSLPSFLPSYFPHHRVKPVK